MKLVNCTPHVIVLQSSDGTRTSIAPSGFVARVASVPGVPSTFDGIPVPVYSPSTYGSLQGVPDPEDGTFYIVSALAVQARGARVDLVAPGTGPQDGAIRNASGQIESVTRLVKG